MRRRQEWLGDINSRLHAASVCLRNHPTGCECWFNELDKADDRLQELLATRGFDHDTADQVLLHVREANGE